MPLTKAFLRGSASLFLQKNEREVTLRLKFCRNAIIRTLQDVP